MRSVAQENHGRKFLKGAGVLKTFSITDIGKKRTMNQDYVFSSEKPVGVLPNLFIVADGMGGHNGGGFASSYAVDVFLESVEKSNEISIRKVISEGIATANRRIREKAASDEELFGMGTTLVVATIDDEYLQVANVGDSRLYRFRQGKLKQISRDQSLVQLLYEEGSITMEERRTHVHRNIIFPVFGNLKSDPQIDFMPLDGMEYGDVLLLCTDGLSDCVSPLDIEEILEYPEPLKNRLKRLIKKSLEKGCKDNITVIAMVYYEDEQ